MTDLTVADMIDELKRINPNYVVKIIVIDGEGNHVLRAVEDIRIVSGSVVLK